ncbi:nitrogenase [Nostocales cyanobacterium HT-58-2]|nr:nitrogenase [Nostocales cyanobacterium HT-58-2]
MQLVNLITLAKTPLQSLRTWLESLEVHNYKLAQFLCKFVPSRCPFERKITFFNYTILQIPPLCKLNPFYEQLVMLRYKSLVYLADECGEDVTVYC